MSARIRTFARLLAGAMAAACCHLGPVEPSPSAAPEAAAGNRQVEDGPRLSFVETNGIRMRIAEQGEGPLVVFLHGWPETWYAWRHQLRAVAAAGYHAVAPDLRGFGASDAPPAIEDYDVLDIAGDIVGLLDALGEETAVLVGHDWGAAHAWQIALLYPDRFTGLAILSVPFGGRSANPPLAGWRRRFGDDFFYILYFQEPGVAEAELGADPREFLRRVYTSPGMEVDPPEITDPKASAGGWLPRLSSPHGLPPWLSQEDFDHCLAELARSGLRGGLNYYRNFDRNWQLTAELAGRQVTVPVIFLAGDQDLVLRILGITERSQLESRMAPVVPHLRSVQLLPGVGHWIQQERPEEVNAALLDFLGSLGEPGIDQGAAAHQADRSPLSKPSRKMLPSSSSAATSVADRAGSSRVKVPAAATATVPASASGLAPSKR
jgi:epoxide hydrolase A/B